MLIKAKPEGDFLLETKGSFAVVGELSGKFALKNETASLTEFPFLIS